MASNRLAIFKFILRFFKLTENRPVGGSFVADDANDNGVDGDVGDAIGELKRLERVSAFSENV